MKLHPDLVRLLPTMPLSARTWVTSFPARANARYQARTGRPSGFERALVSVHVRSGTPIELPGLRLRARPELAVVPHVAGLSGWMVTHVPTGMGMLRDYTTQALARKNALAFAGLPVPDATWALTKDRAFADAMNRIPGFPDVLRQANSAAYAEAIRSR